MKEAINTLRRFCKMKGIKGKGKKKLRREIAKNASAKSALESTRTSGGLVNVQPQG